MTTRAAVFLLVASVWILLAPGAEADTRKLTAGESAAQGPLPGDVALYMKELSCAAGDPAPGYYRPSLNPAEITGPERSGFFPCANFTGSHEGPNQVFAWRSEDDYPGISYIVTREPGELYIVGGEYPTPGDPLLAPFVAKADATTGKQQWRTYLDNANASGRWIGNANLNILETGNIVFAWSNRVVLIDPDSGEILRFNTLPTGEAPAEDVNFKHVTVAPDGTLILKDQTRPIGCTVQGTMGIIKCVAQGMKMPPSVLLAVDPDTLEVLDELPLPGPAPSPHIVAKYRDRIAVYMGIGDTARRYFWDPKARKLSADEDWVVHPLKKGQTALTAPTMVGPWVAFQLNGLFTDKAASSVVVIHEDDAEKTRSVFPFGELQPGEWSFAPPKAGADPENHMIYSADMGMKKVAGIKLDPETGELETAFVVDAISNTFQPVIGPKDRRVLLVTNIELALKSQTIREAVFTMDKYKEQLTWRDASTGEILAESDFFEPLTINSLTSPGFGGRVYFPTAVGRGFYVLEVEPKPAAPSK